MKIYLVRHGETDWNLENRVQGQTDNPLNATGIHQAEALRDNLKTYDFDICYCSPLKRAVKTAEIILSNRDVKIIFDDDLKERNYGNFEGTDSKALQNNIYEDISLNTDENGIEPIRELLARSKRFLERIKTENLPDSKILIVGHGILLKSLYFNIVGYDDNTDFNSFRLKNGTITEYDI